MVIFFPSIHPSLRQLLPERLQEAALPEAVLTIQETYAEDFPCLLRSARNAKRKEHGSKE